MDNKLLDSICTITYNQEKFIAKAIEGVVSQKCDFKFEMVIGEDGSTDKTREIIQSYADKYPDIIVPLFAVKNEGAKANAAKSLMACKGKYIAFLEGDDYWTDPYKLQKQFNFMEANPEYSMCFTRVNVVDENDNEAHDPYPVLTKEDFTIEDIIKAERVFIPTPTLFFRNAVIPKPLPKFYVEARSGDIAMHLLLCDVGKARCLPGKTGIYREHPGGITKTEKAKAEGVKQLFQLFINFNEYSGYKYDKLIRQRLSQMSKIKLIFGSKDLKGVKKIKYVSQHVSDYFKYSELNIKEIAYYSVVLFFPSLLRLKK